MINFEFDGDELESLYSERTSRDPEYHRLIEIYCQEIENGGCRFDPDNKLKGSCESCPHFMADKERYVLETVTSIINEKGAELFIPVNE